MFERLTLGKRMAAGYVLATILMLVISGLAYQSIDHLIETSDWVTHTHEVIEELEGVLSGLKDAETGQRGFLLTGSEAYLQPFNEAGPVIEQKLDHVTELTSDNDRQQQRISRLRDLIKEKMDELEETIELRRHTSFEAALEVVLTDRGKTTMDRIRRLVSSMEDEERRLLERREKAASDGAAVAVNTILASAGVGLLLMFAFSYGLSRSVARRVGSAIEAIEKTGRELVATTSQQAAAVRQTVAAVSETATILAEVQQTSELTTTKAGITVEAGGQSIAKSQTATQAVEQGMQSMQQIREDVSRIAGNILELSEKNISIGEFVQSVNLLAEQSNLLSVNAAIEAAEAGEHGRRFAVVAGEVKALAEQSKLATKQIRDILADVQKSSNMSVMVTEQGTKRVEEGTKVIGLLGDVIEELAQSIRDATDAAEQIAASSREQLTGIEQISTAMDEIERASKEASESAITIENSAKTLAEVGDSLVRLVRGGKAPG